MASEATISNEGDRDPAHSIVDVTVAGQTYTASQLGAGTVAVAQTTLTVGGPAVTIGGQQTLSVGSSGLIVDGTTTLAFSADDETTQNDGGPGTNSERTSTQVSQSLGVETGSQGSVSAAATDTVVMVSAARTVAPEWAWYGFFGMIMLAV